MENRKATGAERAGPDGDRISSGDLNARLGQARELARLGDNERAKSAYVSALELDPANFHALTELANLALSTGHRSAAMTAYRQAMLCHPENPFGLVNLANMLLEDGETGEAKRYYEAALARDPDLAFAHQGLAVVYDRLGDRSKAANHRDKGFAGHSVSVRPYRGTGTPLRVLLIVSALGGNVPTNIILDERLFAVTAVYAEYHDDALALPAHDIVFNAVGDADLCATAIPQIERICARSRAPIINPPASIRDTGRYTNAQRLSTLENVRVPKAALFAREILGSADGASHLKAAGFRFPLLVRAPGFHTGQHFARIECAAELADAVSLLPGDELIAIEFLDARDANGMTRKYRVMFIDGAIYPLHLALSQDWKVHYFTSSMAADEAFRKSEARFLYDMESAIGGRGMRALERLRDKLAFDYGGADFGLSADGQILLFEANATMAIVPPPQDAMWDYRRGAISKALRAARAMVFGRAGWTLPENIA